MAAEPKRRLLSFIVDLQSKLLKPGLSAFDLAHATRVGAPRPWCWSPEGTAAADRLPANDTIHLDGRGNIRRFAAGAFQILVAVLPRSRGRLGTERKESPLKQGERKVHGRRMRLSHVA